MGLITTIVVSTIAVLGAIVIGAFLIDMYNGLIRLKNNIKKAWSNIDVLLKQRSDELPKLISTVKGYMKHEKGTLEAVMKARTAFLNAKTVHEKAETNNQITGALKTLFAVTENYPQLQANDNFKHLQTRISDLESEIADRREFYNDSVNTYNIKIHSFPDMFVASRLGYKDEELFKVSAQDREDVKINF